MILLTYCSYALWLSGARLDILPRLFTEDKQHGARHEKKDRRCCITYSRLYATVQYSTRQQTVCNTVQLAPPLGAWF